MALMVLTMAVLGAVAAVAARRREADNPDVIPVRVKDERHPRR